MSGLLGKISKGKQPRSPRLIVYGEAGAGKSTFAAGFPNPLFLDCERRTGHLDVDRIDITSWQELLAAVKDILTSEHDYKTLVIDTIDHAELMIHDYLCKRDGVASIDDVGGGWGKGHTESLGEWRKLASGMEAMRKKDIGIVMLAHSHVQTFKNPAGPDYDKYRLKMNAKSANFLREISDALGFAHFEDLVKEDAKTKKAKGISTGERILSFEHSAAFESKKGIPMPDEVALSYEAFAEGLKGE